MKHIKKFEKETDEYWNKIVSGGLDISSDEFKNLTSKQFEIDRKYKKYKHKYLIAEIYYPYYNKKRIDMVKCISTFLNHMFVEVFDKNDYGPIKGKYNNYTKSSIEVKLQNIEIIKSFNTFKEAEEIFLDLQKYNL